MQHDVAEPEDADGEGVEVARLFHQHVAEREHERVGKGEGEAEERPLEKEFGHSKFTRGKHSRMGRNCD